MWCLIIVNDNAKLNIGEFDESCIAEYANVLKANYQKQSLPAEGLLEPSNKMCHLAMIQREKLSRHEINDEFVQQTITGKVDDILHMKTPVELKSIFNDVLSVPKVVLIEGAPGAGKSSLSLNICKKWSEGELFQEYTAAVLVRLRDPCIQLARSISELLPHCEKSVSKRVESVIVATEGENILWVLDGWDEFPEHLKKDEQCLVRNLIYKQSHNSSVIVTSRPISSVGLHPLVSKRIEILGFTSEELRQYFVYRLKGDIKSVEILLDKIREYPEVESSCYLPLHAGFIADTFLMKKQDLPSTQYGIFESVIVKCISRYQIKHGREVITSLDNLDSDVQRNVLAICKLAYKGILENKIIFTDRDLSTTDFKSLDLLQEVETMVTFQARTSRTYNFLHLSVQEFLAAQELARRPLYEQYWLFKGLMDEDRCLPMLTFYAAKTKLSSPGIADFVSKVGDRYLQARNEHEQEQLCGLLAFVFKCICETEDPSLCKPLVEALSGRFFMISHIYDYYSFGSFLSLSSCCTFSGTENRIMIGDIKRSMIQNHDWALFVKGLLRFYRSKCVSVLETTSLTVTASDPVLDILRAPDTQLLDVPHLCVLNERGPKLKRRARTSGRSLDGRSLDVPTPGRFRDMLKRKNTVSSLEIRGINGSCGLVAEGLRSNSSLRELHFVGCSSISPQEFQCLCDGLCYNLSVQVLDFSNCCLSSVVGHISDIFKHNVTLVELKLRDCRINSDHLSLITSFGKLETIVLSSNKIGNKGAKYLERAFQNNKTLQKLILSNCGITAQGSSFLLKIFQNGTLKCLDTLTLKEVIRGHFWHMHEFMIPAMSVSPCLDFTEESSLQIAADNDGGTILTRLIRHDYPLQTLILSSGDIDYAIINSIFEVLKQNTNLIYFQIKNGHFSEENIKTIAESLKENVSLVTVLLDNELDISPEFHSVFQESKLRSVRKLVLRRGHVLLDLVDCVANSVCLNRTLNVLRLPHQFETIHLRLLKQRLIGQRLTVLMPTQEHYSFSS